MLRERYATTDNEWEGRLKARPLKIGACSKALALLTSDGAHNLLNRTVNPTLLQLLASKTSGRLAQAFDLPLAAAHNLETPRLATLAVKVRLDVFERVN